MWFECYQDASFEPPIDAGILLNDETIVVTDVEIREMSFHERQLLQRMILEAPEHPSITIYQETGYMNRLLVKIVRNVPCITTLT